MRRTGIMTALVCGMALWLGLATAGVQAIDDWADTNDHWGDAISYNSSRVTIDTANNVLRMFSSSSSDTTSGEAVNSYTPDVPDASYWWDLSGNGYDRFTFTYKNTGTTAHVWDGVGPSGNDNSYVGFNFKRYSDARLNPNTVRWNLWDLIIDATGDGVVDAGETITITGMFDDYDWRSRTDMYGWDTPNDRYVISGWWLRKQYDSYGANSPYELSPILFTTAAPPPAPIPEPAGIALLGIGLLAMRRKRRRFATALVSCVVLCLGLATAGVYNDAIDGRYNASDVDTWGAGLNVYPSAAGDTANIDSNTVRAAAVGEVPAGATVNLSGGGTLRLNNQAAQTSNVIDPAAALNIATGGTLLVGTRNSINMTAPIVLNGGALGGTHYTTRIGGTIDVQSDSHINFPDYTQYFGDSGTYVVTATGGGNLTFNCGAYDSRMHVKFSNASTWTGNWDIQTGFPTFYNTAYTAPADVRIAAGAGINHIGSYSYVGTISGDGRIGIYAGNTVTLNGALSPGDSVGNIDAYSTSGGGDQTPRLQFATGSTYVVDIMGTTNAEYDYFTITGKNDGTGRIDIQSGATLDITLWTPSDNTTLDATILSALTGNGAPGQLTGSFDNVVWNASGAWKHLAVTQIGQDLHVTGEFVSAIPEPAGLSALGLAVLALRRKRA